jgi:hypothetical protein
LDHFLKDVGEYASEYTFIAVVRTKIDLIPLYFIAYVGLKKKNMPCKSLNAKGRLIYGWE